MIEKLKKKFIPVLLFCIVFVFAVLISPKAFADDENTYTITFRTGGHGSLTYGSNVEVQSFDLELEEGSTFNLNTITCNPDSGDADEDAYYVSGWAPEDEVASDGTITVNEKASYVAQWKRITDSAVYRVHYVDNYGNELATQEVRKTQAGIVITEYALPIDGYAVDQASQQFTLSSGETRDITFTYTSTESLTNTQIQTVYIPGGTAITTTGGQTAGTAATPNGTAAAGSNGAVVNQRGTTTTVDDNQTPLANQQSQDDSGLTTTQLIAIVVGAGLIIAAVLLAAKKRRKRRS